MDEYISRISPALLEPYTVDRVVFNSVIHSLMSTVRFMTRHPLHYKIAEAVAQIILSFASKRLMWKIMQTLRGDYSIKSIMVAPRTAYTYKTVSVNTDDHIIIFPTQNITIKFDVSEVTLISNPLNTLSEYKKPVTIDWRNEFAPISHKYTLAEKMEIVSEISAGNIVLYHGYDKLLEDFGFRCDNSDTGEWILD